MEKSSSPPASPRKPRSKAAALAKLFYDPRDIGAPAQELRRRAKERGVTVSLKFVREWLKSQEVAQQHTRERSVRSGVFVPRSRVTCTRLIS